MARDELTYRSPDPRFLPITQATGIVPLTAAAVLIAWLADGSPEEGITEGAAAETLSIDRLSLRELRDEMIREGREAWEASRKSLRP